MTDLFMYLFFGFDLLIVVGMIHIFIWPAKKRPSLKRWWPGIR